MPWFIQANDEGRGLCTILTERTPIHPRQIGPYSDLPDIERKRLDLATMELVDDSEYWKEIEDKQRRGDELKRLALLQIESLYKSGELLISEEEWAVMDDAQKMEFYLNFTKP
jgi:hypothetical protein